MRSKPQKEPKRNCWEIMNCNHFLWCTAFMGRGGKQTPHGPHGGRTAGRACWAISGTIGGSAHCKCLLEVKVCSLCRVFRRVHQEEGPSILPSEELSIIIDQWR